MFYSKLFSERFKFNSYTVAYSSNNKTAYGEILFFYTSNDQVIALIQDFGTGQALGIEIKHIQEMLVAVNVNSMMHTFSIIGVQTDS